MKSWTASFYDPYAGESIRPTIRPARRTILLGLAIGVAVLILLALIAADVAAYEALPAKVTITQIYWFSGEFALGNESGFTVAGGHTFEVNLNCEIFCPNFVRAEVSAPFTLAHASFAYPWDEYVNLTVQAPTTAYDGPLDVTLAVGNPA